MRDNRLNVYAHQRSHNTLIRRVRRHATIATLFRTPDYRLAPHPNTEATLTPVTEGVLSAEIAPYAKALPIQVANATSQHTGVTAVPAASIPATGVPHSGTIAVQRYLQRGDGDVQVTDTLPTATTPAPTTMQRRQITAASPPSTSSQPQIPTTSSITGSGTDNDPNWQRLKTIYRKHQEKAEASEAAQPAPAVSPQAPQEKQAPVPTAEAPQIQLLSEIPAQRTTAHARATGAHHTEAQFPASADAHPAVDTQRTLDETVTSPAQVQRQAVVTRGETTQAPATRTKDGAAEAPTTTEADATPDNQHVTGETAPSLVQAERHETVERIQRAMAHIPPSHIVTSPESASPAATPQAHLADIGEDAGNQAIQHIHARPLQDVWPVVQRATPVPSPALLQAERQPSDKDLTTSDDDAKVRRALAAIAPERATSSSVEVIMPSRPRPVVAPPGPSEPSMHTTATQPEASRLSVQAKTQRSPDSHEVASNNVVATDIGPLPADLWTFLGESPPREGREVVATDTSPPLSSTAVSTGERKSTIEGSTLEAEGAPTQPDTPKTTVQTALFPIKSQPVPASIQDATTLAGSVQDALRNSSPEVAESPGLTVQEATTTSMEGATQMDTESSMPSDTETKPESKGQDFDELARQVYGEIKRRLAVEWERFRRQG